MQWTMEDEFVLLFLAVKFAPETEADYEKAIKSWPRNRESPSAIAFRSKLQNLRRIQPARYWRSLDWNYKKEGANPDFKLFRDSDPADLDKFPNNVATWKSDEDTGNRQGGRLRPDNEEDEEDMSSMTEMVETAENRSTSPRLGKRHLLRRAQNHEHGLQSDNEDGATATEDGSDIETPSRNLDVSASARQLARLQENRVAEASSLVILEDDGSETTEELQAGSSDIDAAEETWSQITGSDACFRHAVQSTFQVHIRDLLRPGHSYRHPEEGDYDPMDGPAPLTISFQGEDVFAGIQQLVDWQLVDLEQPEVPRCIFGDIPAVQI